MKISAKNFAKHVIKTAKKPKEMPSSQEPDVKDALDEMERRLERKEVDSTSMISNQIKGFENELRILEKEREEDIEENKNKINEVYKLMNNINEKLNKLIEIKTERERKVKELERKVRKKSDKNQQEILNMEDKLKNMELRYRKLKMQRKFSPEQLENIRKSIYSFKQKLEARRRGFAPDMEVADELFSEIPSKHGERSIRHTMKFEAPFPKRAVPAEEIKPELPSLPSLQEMPKAVEEKEPEIPKVPSLDLPPLPKPKRTFLKKLEIMLFGKPKKKF